MKKFVFSRRSFSTRQILCFKSLLAGILIACLLIPVLTGYINRIDEQKRRSRIAVSETIHTDMSALCTIGRKMRYAGADIKGTLLPKVKTHAYSLSRLNDVCASAFGEKYRPIDKGFMRHLSSAVTELETVYANGSDAKKCENTLADYLEELSHIMDARFDDKMDILPIER